MSDYLNKMHTDALELIGEDASNELAEESVLIFNEMASSGASQRECEAAQVSYFQFYFGACMDNNR
jgi:hypothetical protein